MINEPQNFRDLFFNGMKRGVSAYLPVPPGGTHLNLGAGHSPIKGAVNLDQPTPTSYQKTLSNANVSPHNPGDYAWNAPLLRAYENESIAAVHAYHFFEHLSADEMYVMISEIARVLKPKGVVYYCVPYAMAPIAHMDITHQTFWTEETMRTLLTSRGYDSAAVENTKGLTIEFQVIAGITSQNIAVLGALQKIGE